MLIPSIYLIIAGQVALIMVFLIAYLIYMLVSEENRWEDYTDKLKSKIRELQEFKSRFDIVSENLHKQMDITKELTQKVEKFDSQLEAKDYKITQQESFITELQKTLSDLQNIINGLEEKEKLLNESTINITELKTQLALLEDQGAEFPEQINGLNLTIETLETENNTLKFDINEANETITQYKQNADNVRNDDFNLTIEGVDKTSNNDFDLLNNIKSRYQDEMDRLKKNYKNQKHIIDDLESALMSARNNPDEPVKFDLDAITKLNQMLAESNTVVEMLEGEIDTLQAEINQLMAQNNALTAAIENSSSTQSDADETENSAVTTDDVFFEDAAEDDTNTDSSQDSNNDVFFDIDSGSDDVFFDVDSSVDATSTQNDNSNATDIAPELEQLQMQLDSANQMAMTMMMTSGDQGNIINFARNSIQFESLKDLAKGVLETVALFQVNGALQLRGDEHDPFNVSSYGKLTAQDSEKISTSEGSERFLEDGPELLIQFKELTLLIKDMPLSDSDKMGRIKDNMAIALELACANLSSIEAALKIKKNQKILNQVLKNTYETIQNVEEQFNEQNNVTNQVINSLTGIISNPAMTAGMDPIYRDVFTSIINDGKSKFDAIKETGVAIDGNFAEIVKRLGSKINE